MRSESASRIGGSRPCVPQRKSVRVCATTLGTNKLYGNNLVLVREARMKNPQPWSETSLAGADPGQKHPSAYTDHGVSLRELWMDSPEFKRLSGHAVPLKIA